MAYENELDKKLFCESVELGEFKFDVGVYEYNGNEQKIQISRLNGDKHLKLGRLTVQEADCIMPLLENARTFIKNGINNTPEETEEETLDVEEEKPEEKKEEAAEEKKDVEALFNKPLPEFRITLSDIAPLRDALANIKQSIIECPVMISKDCMHMRSMDAANVAMVNFKLFSSACVEWDVKETFACCINVGNFYEIIKNTRKNDVIVISRKDDNRLRIMLKNSVNQEFEIPVISIEDRWQKMPELQFTATVSIPSRMLEEQMRGAEKVAESVRFTAEKGNLKIKADGELNNFNSEISEDEGIKIGLKECNSVSSKYSTAYLKKMTKVKRLAEECNIEFSKDYPISLKYCLGNEYLLHWILAPTVDECA